MLYSIMIMLYSMMIMLHSIIIMLYSIVIMLYSIIIMLYSIIIIIIIELRGSRGSEVLEQSTFPERVTIQVYKNSKYQIII